MPITVNPLSGAVLKTDGSTAVGTFAPTGGTGPYTFEVIAVSINGAALAATESGADTAAFTGTAAVPVTGSLAATEIGSDSAAFNGGTGIFGSLIVIEFGADTAAFSGSITVSGTAPIVEVGSDTFAATADAPRTGTLVAVEIGSDIAVFYESEPQFSVQAVVTGLWREMQAVNGVWR